jgi:diaminopimelate decarboxylase
LIKSNQDLVKLAGFHIHLGSTIKTVEIYRNSVRNLIALINSTLDKHGIDEIELVNFGGGLGIDYEKFSYRTSYCFFIY